MTDDAIRPQAAPAGPKPVHGLGGWPILPMLGLLGSIISALTRLPDMFLREVVQPISALCVWTPYLLSSGRVKNTFVK